MAFETPDPKQKHDSGGLKTLVQAEKMMQIAIMLPAAVFIGYILGYWLDKMLHQTWISIVGLLLGGAAGLTSVIRMVLHTGKDGDSDV
ncbi:MAG TPA: AtpZ/AtpI family protein [Acidisarcina sp.]|nr:AtpZ/AtpI family protein [Acidisarcina sp.]